MLNLKREPIDSRVSELLALVRSWAEQHPSITAVALAGSHAHGRARPDSDVDLVILADSPDPLRNSNWLGAFGTVQECSTKQWGILTSHHAHYEEHGEVEVGIAPTSWADIPVDPGTQQVVADGIIIILDPHGKLKRLIEAVQNRDST